MENRIIREELKVIKVRYAHFPDTTNGLMGFYSYATDHQCVKPRYEYVKEKGNGYCHITNAEEMDELAKKVGALTREEFIAMKRAEGKTSWKNAYSEYLSEKVGQQLESGGIVLTIHHEVVKFSCPKGEFVPWKIKNRT